MTTTKNASAWRVGLLAAALTGALTTAAPVQAHHSTSGYDYTKTLTLSGTVDEFQWTNPHMFIKLAAPHKGKTAIWNVECGTPNINVRHGWKKTDIKKGDKLVMQISPMRDGTPAATLISVKLKDGRTLYGPGVDIRGAGPPGGPAPGNAPPAR